MSREQPETEWRCRACSTLIGVERGGKIHLKYKKAQFVVQGSVLAVCRYCSQLNERKTSPTARDGPADSAAVTHEPAPVS